MNKREAGNRTGRGASLSDIRFQRWTARAYGLAGACLFALAIAEFFNFATPPLRTFLMLGILAAGTAAWVMQAKRKCASCGRLYGYHFRIVKANTCRYCGAEFPKWHPGEEDDAEQE